MQEQMKVMRSMMGAAMRGGCGMFQTGRKTRAVHDVAIRPY
jgi:hypothetical protein